MSSPDDAQPGSETSDTVATVDELRTPLLDRMAGHLGDALVATELLPGLDAWARVDVEAWAETARVCRDELDLTYFCYLSAIDWLPSPYGKSEDPDAELPPRPAPGEPLDHGVTGGDTRFQLLARLESVTTHVGLTLKADVPDDQLAAPTWTGVFAGADWHEREAWEMFGIHFVGHPHLINLYLPTGFEGHPLRKDFPLLSRMVKPWPGLVDVEAMPGEPDEPAESDAETEDGS